MLFINSFLTVRGFAPRMYERLIPLAKFKITISLTAGIRQRETKPNLEPELESTTRLAGSLGSTFVNK